MKLDDRRYRGTSSRRRRKNGATRRGSRPGLEALEGRTLLASRLFALPVTDTSSIVELNPSTGAEMNQFAAPVPAASDGENGLAFDGQVLYYLPYDGTGRLWELNPDTGAVLKSAVITAGSGHFDGLGAVDGKVYLQDDINHDLVIVESVERDRHRPVERAGDPDRRPHRGRRPIRAGRDRELQHRRIHRPRHRHGPRPDAPPGPDRRRGLRQRRPLLRLVAVRSDLRHRPLGESPGDAEHAVRRLGPRRRRRGAHAHSDPDADRAGGQRRLRARHAPGLDGVPGAEQRGPGFQVYQAPTRSRARCPPRRRGPSPRPTTRPGRGPTSSTRT